MAAPFPKYLDEHSRILAHEPLWHLLANDYRVVRLVGRGYYLGSHRDHRPAEVTARIRRLVIVGFEGDGWLPVYDLVEIVRNGHDTCIVVDPRPDLDRTLSRIREDVGDGPWISVLGVARLDVADRLAHRALLSALEDRWAGNWFDMPYIEF